MPAAAPEEPDVPARERRARRAAYAAVVLLAVAPYAGTLRHGFVLDDGPEVVQNEYVRTGDLRAIFTTTAWEGAGRRYSLYRPLTTASYALNHALGGYAPAGYHAVNGLLHALASALVLAAGLALGLPLAGAALGAALFAVHPVHVEVVANVAGRKDALAALFALATLLLHVRALRRAGAALALAPLALGAALLSKETGAAAIAIVAARDLLAGRDDWRRARRRGLGLAAGYAAVLAAYVAARWLVVGGLGWPRDEIGFGDNPLVHAPPPVRMATAVALLGKGLGLLAWPATLSPDYSYAAVPPVEALADPRLILGATAIAAALAAAALSWRRRPLVPLAVASYAAAILPGSNLLVPVGTVFGERLLYLPSAAACLAAGACAAALVGRARRAAGARTRAVVAGATAAGVLAVAGLAVRAGAYASVWSDGLSLFSHAVRVQPASYRAHESLGATYMMLGRPADAVPELARALAILEGTPASVQALRVELGVAHEGAGDLAAAERLYGEVLREEPGNADAWWRTGVVRWREGRRREAVEAWRRAVGLRPDHARALSDLGLAALASGDEERARVLWERAVRADPGLPGTWLRLGDAWARAGRPDLARAAWLEFLSRAGDAYPRERAEVTARLAGR